MKVSLLVVVVVTWEGFSAGLKNHPVEMNIFKCHFIIFFLFGVFYICWDPFLLCFVESVKILHKYLWLFFLSMLRFMIVWCSEGFCNGWNNYELVAKIMQLPKNVSKVLFAYQGSIGFFLLNKSFTSIIKG